MTDNNIIKGLEICCTDKPCYDCPYTGRCRYGKSILKDALDLINRQKAELDDLKRDDLPRCKDALRRANEIGMDVDKENQELREEIERLKYANQTNISSIATLHEELKTAKAEAIKEFAERMKEYREIVSYDRDFDAYVYGSHIHIDIDEFENLVKEIAGER